MSSIKNLYLYIHDDNNDEVQSLNKLFRSLRIDYEECVRLLNKLGKSFPKGDKPISKSEIDEMIIRAVKVNKLLEKIKKEKFSYFKGTPFNDVLCDIDYSKRLTNIDSILVELPNNNVVYKYLEGQKIDEEDLLELFKIDYLHDKGNLDRVLTLMRM